MVKPSRNPHVRKLQYESFGLYGQTGYPDRGDFEKKKQKKAREDRMGLWGY